MTKSRQNRRPHGVIAALEYHACPRMGFADIVEEFDIAAQFPAARSRSLTWVGEDIALLDRGAVRIGLGWKAPETPGASCYLVIAVGPPPGAPEGRFDPKAYDMLARRIIERVQGYLPFDAVLHGDAHQPVSAGAIGMTFDLLRKVAPDTPRQNRRNRGHGPDGSARRDGPSAAPEDGTAEGAQHLPDPPTVPMRLTIFTFSITLMMHAPPVGAALLVYTILREVYPVVT